MTAAAAASTSITTARTTKLQIFQNNAKVNQSGKEPWDFRFVRKDNVAHHGTATLPKSPLYILAMAPLPCNMSTPLRLTPERVSRRDTTLDVVNTVPHLTQWLRAVVVNVPVIVAVFQP